MIPHTTLIESDENKMGELINWMKTISQELKLPYKYGKDQVWL